MLQSQLAELARVEQPTMAALLAPAAKERLDRIGKQAKAGFSARERATFVQLLRRVITNLEEAGETERAMRAITRRGKRPT